MLHLVRPAALPSSKTFKSQVSKIQIFEFLDIILQKWSWCNKRNRATFKTRKTSARLFLSFSFVSQFQVTVQWSVQVPPLRICFSDHTLTLSVLFLIDLNSSLLGWCMMNILCGNTISAFILWVQFSKLHQTWLLQLLAGMLFLSICKPAHG